MAITKIHAIQATVHKAVNYICNSQKTDESILISSFGCSPETAAFDFKFALSKTNQADPNKAFHLIQAFAPGEDYRMLTGGEVCTIPFCGCQMALS